jgi:ribosome-associated protein
MKEIKIKDEFIKLGQALKLAGAVDSGLDAKFVIQDGAVTVNDEVELRRGRKLYKDDIFSYDGNQYIIKS